MLHGFKKWEAALLAGVLAGVLASPAGAAEPLVLSRWAVGEAAAPRYQISLFPFGLRAAEEYALAVPPQGSAPEYEIRFRLLDWLEEIRCATNR